jgi:hypothetical protein
MRVAVLSIGEILSFGPAASFSCFLPPTSEMRRKAHAGQGETRYSRDHLSSPREVPQTRQALRTNRHSQLPKIRKEMKV